MVVVRAAALAGPGGDSIADAVAAEARTLGGQSGEAWLALAAAWSVATAAGAPLAGCLRELAASFRQLGQLQRDVQVALAGPVATARMVMGLPVIGIVFGALMGFDTLHTLFATLPGLLCLVAGSALMFAGSRWNARLVRSAQTTDAAPGLQLDLTAIAMAGGGSVDRARSLVRAATERYGLDGAGSHGPRRGGPRSARSDGARSDEAIDAVLDLSTRAGVPAAELLRSEADQGRRDASSEGRRKAATLAVTLMLPLGVCVLPAFMLVGVVPLLLAVVTSTFSTF
jgi:tight adherence protein B